MAAVAQNGWALQFASEELKNDKEFVLAAVAQDARALKYASDKLKKEMDLRKEMDAVEKNWLINVLPYLR